VTLSGSSHQTLAGTRIDPGAEIPERLSINRRAAPNQAGRSGPPNSVAVVADIVIVPRPRPRFAIGIFRIVSAGGVATAKRMQSRRQLTSAGR
jgi:hypothetical protein